MSFFLFLNVFGLIISDFNYLLLRKGIIVVCQFPLIAISLLFNYLNSGRHDDSVLTLESKNGIYIRLFRQINFHCWKKTTKVENYLQVRTTNFDYDMRFNH